MTGSPASIGGARNVIWEVPGSPTGPRVKLPTRTGGQGSYSGNGIPITTAEVGIQKLAGRTIVTASPLFEEPLRGRCAGLLIGPAPARDSPC
jgi:hypothetical protein